MFSGRNRYDGRTCGTCGWDHDEDECEVGKLYSQLTPDDPMYWNDDITVLQAWCRQKGQELYGKRSHVLCKWCGEEHDSGSCEVARQFLLTQPNDPLLKEIQLHYNVNWWEEMEVLIVLLRKKVRDMKRTAQVDTISAIEANEQPPVFPNEFECSDVNEKTPIAEKFLEPSSLEEPTEESATKEIMEAAPPTPLPQHHISSIPSSNNTDQGTRVAMILKMARDHLILIVYVGQLGNLCRSVALRKQGHGNRIWDPGIPGHTRPT